MAENPVVEALTWLRDNPIAWVLEPETTMDEIEAAIPIAEAQARVVEAALLQWKTKPESTIFALVGALRDGGFLSAPDEDV